MRIWLAVILVAACGNSQAPSPTPTTPAPTAPAPTAPGAPAPPVANAPAPDPIMRPFTEEQARAEASRLARSAFERRTDIKDAAGKRVPLPAYEPSAFTGGLVGDRWTFSIDPPAGAYAHVSFGRFGRQPKIDVGFATE